MNLVDLKNSLTLWLSSVSFTFFPENKITLTFVLYPTIGAIYQQTFDLLMSWTCEWSSRGTPSEQAIVVAFLGKSTQEIKDAVLIQWVEYSANRAFDPKFQSLFNYVKLAT